MGAVRVVLVLLAGTAVSIAPYVLYCGEIFCKMHHLEAPKTDSFMVGALTAIATIIIYAFPKKKGSDDENK